MNILNYLSEDEKKLLQYKELSRGEILFRESDECRKIGIVLKGELIIASYLEDGNRIIYSHLKEDDIFGNNLLFSSSPYYKGDVIAIKDSRIALIEKEDLMRLLMSDASFMNEYLRLQSDAGIRLNLRIRLLSIASAKERLLYYLYENGNVVSFSSISALAEDLSLSRETLSRLLSSLTKEKRIIKDKKKIRLL